MEKKTGKGTGVPSKADIKRKKEADKSGEGFIFLDDNYWMGGQAEKDAEEVDKVRAAHAGKKYKRKIKRKKKKDEDLEEELADASIPLSGVR